MSSLSPSNASSGRERSTWRLGRLALLLMLLAVPVVLAESPAPPAAEDDPMLRSSSALQPIPRPLEQPPTIGGFQPLLPLAPDKPPRPAKGPGSVEAALEGISRNDAAFEVTVGQGRILTTKMDLTVKDKAGLVAVGDPLVLDFAIVSPRQLRVIGQRIGVTDLSITTPDGQTYNFEVHVLADLGTLRLQLRTLFPDASLRLAQIRDHIVVEGQARDAGQVGRIMETIEAYLLSVQRAQPRPAGGAGRPAAPGPRAGGIDMEPVQPPAGTAPAGGASRGATGTAGTRTGQVINMIRVPGSKQVLLKVRVAELNRTAFRQVGSDLLFSGSSATTGTRLGHTQGASGATGNGGLAGSIQSLFGSGVTTFGIFPEADFAVFFSAMRRNSLVRILAEPNLVALNGHSANFLAGGEFPVPVTQTTVSGGATPNIQFREFGVRLGFLPTILDGDVIRLAVDPEVSNIDPTLATTLVAGGSPVPGLSTRRAHTVVELREGQTLAIAGLLQLTMDGTTARIPGLGDLSILGPFFSNTSGTRQEKELIVLVTPYLVEPTNANVCIPTPGDDVLTPTDFEFYFRSRIEGRTGVDFRATTDYDRAGSAVRHRLQMDAKWFRGPRGYGE